MTEHKPLTKEERRAANKTAKLPEGTPRPASRREPPKKESDDASGPMHLPAGVMDKLGPPIPKTGTPSENAAAALTQPIPVNAPARPPVPPGNPVTFDNLLKLLNNFKENGIIAGENYVYVNGKGLRSVSMISSEQDGFSLQMESE